MQPRIDLNSILGDGTFRKCPHLWRLFRPRGALDFHVIQLQIVTAGIQLLKLGRNFWVMVHCVHVILLTCTGGRLVYSTCSLNPIEDEAVVAALLLKFKGMLQF